MMLVNANANNIMVICYDAELYSAKLLYYIILYYIILYYIIFIRAANNIMVIYHDR